MKMWDLFRRKKQFNVRTEQQTAVYQQHHTEEVLFPVRGHVTESDKMEDDLSCCCVSENRSHDLMIVTSSTLSPRNRSSRGSVLSPTSSSCSSFT